ncbi:MAG: DALR anticodon-binding domain-containing protein [Pseudonocardiaceae bacterium]
MTPAALADLVRSLADDVLTRRGLDPAALPVTVTIERPGNPDHGDYATNVALRTARKAGVAPRELAGWLAEALAASPGVRCADVAGPGFLNLRLATATRGEVIRQVLAAGERFGSTDDPAHGEHSRTLLGSWPAADDVRYAHARLASLARNAADLAVTSADVQLELLEHEQEGELIRTLGEFPRIVASAAQSEQPQRLTRYLERPAGLHHILSDPCRMLPMGDEEPGPLHTARLALCQATRQVLANGLSLLGLSAPERM